MAPVTNVPSTAARKSLRCNGILKDDVDVDADADANVDANIRRSSPLLIWDDGGTDHRADEWELFVARGLNARTAAIETRNNFSELRIRAFSMIASE
jgi:hypothetical protein